MTQDIRKFAFIDALRGVAVLGVLLSHASHGIESMPGSIERLLMSGDIGVRLFFMASALTLFLSMDSRKREAHPVRNYFIRRFFRIAPLYYAGALFYTIWTGGVPIEPTAGRPITAASVFSTLTFVNGWIPPWINQVVPGGWSIAVEMNFYLFVPLLYARLTSLNRTLWAAFVAQILAWSSAKVVARLLIDVLHRPPGTSNAFVSWWFPTQVPAFLLGIAAYFLLRDRLRGVEPSAATTFQVNRGGSLLLLVVALYAYVAFQTHEATAYVPVGLILLLMLICSVGAYPHGLIVNRFFRALGKVSFSAYLTHFAVLEVCTNALRSGILPPERTHWAVYYAALALSTLVGTMAVSTATYHLIEVPGQRAGKWLIGRLERAAVPAVARG